MIKLLQGDSLKVLKTLPDESVHCCVTSPPYLGLRDYGMDGQIGLEKSLQEYIGKMVEIFREVRRVMRNDAALWLNLGDSYCAQKTGTASQKSSTLEGGKNNQIEASKRPSKITDGFKPKDLIGVPWSVAFALRNDGWYLRQDIIWSKPNPMPESVTDRCTKAHEYIFLMAKSGRYYYDQEAIKEPMAECSIKRFESVVKNNEQFDPSKHKYELLTRSGRNLIGIKTCNKRSVWTVATHSYSEAHFATFPPDLIKPCILAGCPKDGTVLDPFGGAGTTGLVADRLGRNAILIELNPKYIQMAQDRIKSDAPLFAEVQSHA